MRRRRASNRNESGNRDMSERPETTNGDVLHDLHAAWNRVDIDALLDCFTEDLDYWSNMGGDGAPFIIAGKTALGSFVRSIAAEYQCSTSIASLKHDGASVRAHIAYTVRNRANGYVDAGTYRQIATFDNGKIARLEDFHDAPRLLAFWRLASAAET